MQESCMYGERGVWCISVVNGFYLIWNLFYVELFKSTLFQGTGFAWESLSLLDHKRYTGIRHSL